MNTFWCQWLLGPKIFSWKQGHWVGRPSVKPLCPSELSGFFFLSHSYLGLGEVPRTPISLGHCLHPGLTFLPFGALFSRLGNSCSQLLFVRASSGSVASLLIVCTLILFCLLARIFCSFLLCHFFFLLCPPVSANYTKSLYRLF